MRVDLTPAFHPCFSVYQEHLLCVSLLSNPISTSSMRTAFMYKTWAERLDLSLKRLEFFLPKSEMILVIRPQRHTVPARLHFSTESFVNVHENWNIFKLNWIAASFRSGRYSFFQIIYQKLAYQSHIHPSIASLKNLVWRSLLKKSHDNLEEGIF